MATENKQKSSPGSRDIQVGRSCKLSICCPFYLYPSTLNFRVSHQMQVDLCPSRFPSGLMGLTASPRKPKWYKCIAGALKVFVSEFGLLLCTFSGPFDYWGDCWWCLRCSIVQMQYVSECETQQRFEFFRFSVGDEFSGDRWQMHNVDHYKRLQIDGNSNSF